jgi:hypothetical protein
MFKVMALKRMINGELHVSAKKNNTHEKDPIINNNTIAFKLFRY